jgi:hypothetical protein
MANMGDPDTPMPAAGLGSHTLPDLATAETASLCLIPACVPMKPLSGSNQLGCR